MTMSYGDVKVQLPSLHPMVSPQQPVDYAATIWNRPGIHCGAPEVPPFPPPPSISPLVSQAGTPTHSRSTSPHRTTTTVNVRMPLTARPPPSSIPPNVDVMPPPVAPPPLSQPVSIDPVTHSSLPPIFGNTNDLKLPDDELNQMPDTQLIDTPWAPPRGILPDNMKLPNGICYPPQYSHKIPVPYLIEQIQALNLEGDNSLHHSNSSSNSSLNQSPPETPTVAPHGPGRGPEKPRVNGIPPPTTFINNLPPMCDTTPPPPAFNNCTVPYTSYPATFNQLPPNSPQYPPRHPTGCYNCGATGHMGNDCTAQNIEEITQKKSYSLDYNSSIRDTENK